MFTITPTNPQRRDRWLHIFSSDRLPVLHDRPRFVVGEDGHERPIYDLALHHLTAMQRARLAAHVHRRTKRPYGDVQREMETRPSYPIAAAGCELVKDEATAVPPSLLRIGEVFACEHLYQLAGQ